MKQTSKGGIPISPVFQMIWPGPQSLISCPWCSSWNKIIPIEKLCTKYHMYKWLPDFSNRLMLDHGSWLCCKKVFFTDNEPIYNLKPDVVKPGLFFQKMYYHNNYHLGHTLKKKSLSCASESYFFWDSVSSRHPHSTTSQVAFSKHLLLHDPIFPQTP